MTILEDFNHFKDKLKPCYFTDQQRIQLSWSLDNPKSSYNTLCMAQTTYQRWGHLGEEPIFRLACPSSSSFTPHPHSRPTFCHPEGEALKSEGYEFVQRFFQQPSPSSSPLTALALGPILMWRLQNCWFFCHLPHLSAMDFHCSQFRIYGPRLSRQKLTK